jgi:hypothetical protein
MNLKRVFINIYIGVFSCLVEARQYHIDKIVLLEFYDRKLLKNIIYN